ncbi:guanylate cyclase soluble subunit beta-1-like [Paramacrobiotus metropolitanus]|uniref:guanylate cyclase soluble subunit beta-1-like n=1 Tax=Paramacrobiotus metropolitanus TaxID=2943436 RepID=UPI00244651EE|nr:guanylate cyclase soluble subunit beta-1-like [Paramacrobiotus metropolitanus]
MYGFVNRAIELLVLRNFGADTWEDIKKEAGVSIDGNFLTRCVYDDEMTFRLVTAAEKILNVPVPKILELFGAFFYDFCLESGYDKILGVLGSTPTAFLENLDALHDHLASIYPGMRAPSFRCTKRDYRSVILHYYSEREGLEPIVIGIVKTVASRLHGKEIDIRVYMDKNSHPDCDHSQFLIEERDANKDQIQDTLERSSTVFTNEPKIAPHTFAQLFPFHVIFDRGLVIRGMGTAFARLLPDSLHRPLDSIFDMLRPHMPFDFKTIVSHINTVFVLQTLASVAKLRKLYIKLKGQMIFLPEHDWVLFICSPSLTNLVELDKAHTHLTDIPLHDATRDLVLMSEHFETEYRLARDMEILTDQLQQMYRDLEDEKKKTDKLVYSILPASVAIELRHNRPVAAKRYEEVTVLFCGVTSFAQFCVDQKNDPMKIVDYLNTIYSKFDALTDPKLNPHVYKVETVNDKYMAVSGLPEENKCHARWIAKLSLEMMDISTQLREDGLPVTITIGLHSGELVTGVIGQRMPRYCLFGNTVNLASRTESTGSKGHINISETAFRYLQDENNFDPSFCFEERGHIAMKGKAEPMEVFVLRKEVPNARTAFLFHPLLKITAV